LKENTFVLDFHNETEDIVKAFDQFHGLTVAPPTDPNILWDTRRRLDDFDVLRPEEIEAAMPALLGAGASDDQRSAETYAALGPAKARFEQMNDEERLEVRDVLTRSSGPTRSSLRSRPSQTPRLSVTTSTAELSRSISATRLRSSGSTWVPRSS
jgi:peptidoglycan hydrolase-like protein with peptidoglycan-binding domain